MYRKYVGEFGGDSRPFSAAAYLSRGVTSDCDTESLPSRPTSTMSLSGVEFALDGVAADDDDAVSRVWDVIAGQMDQRSRRRRRKSRRVVTATAGDEWRTVRVFVSSTFTDFHNEREILVKKVFPALREWCESRKLALVECDLRWGVPKDSTSAVTIATCMAELDRCRDETGRQPFFINMISEKYGWVPGMADLPDELRRLYDWVQGVSITHMEILHGAYRSQNPNAVFFFRSPSFLQGIPFDKTRPFMDDDLSAKLHLKVILDGLDSFAETALEFFKSAIDKQYPNRTAAGDGFSLVDQEEDVHLSVMETKCLYLRGREDEIRVLTAFANAQNGVKGLKVMKTDVRESLAEQGGKESDPPPLCISGDAGIGKSALAANLAKTATQAGLNVLYHCVGCTSESLRDVKILMRIVRRMQSLMSDKGTLLDDQADLFQKLKLQCDKWRTSDKKLLIIVDGVDEIDDAAKLTCLSWLPVRLPPNVRLVLTVRSSHAPCLARLKDRQALQLNLRPVTMATSRDIVEHFFSSFNKYLDQEQLEVLLGKTSSSIPLWLSIACEELRVYGDYRTLTQKVQQLPEGLEGLLHMVLNRLVREDTTGCMIKVLSLIYCAQNGIPESEIPRLLGNPETGEEVPLVTWATVRRALKPFITSVICGYNGVLNVKFFHSAVHQEPYREVLMTKLIGIYLIAFSERKSQLLEEEDWRLMRKLK